MDYYIIFILYQTKHFTMTNHTHTYSQSDERETAMESFGLLNLTGVEE